MKIKKINHFLEMPLNQKFEDPIRDEIFSPERLEQYAFYLSSELNVSSTRKRGKSLLPRLEDNHKCLIKAYKSLTDSVQEDLVVSPAAEWFIDNFHIIEDQVREVREDLPEAYYRELPKVIDGDLADHPQVYVIALSLIAHQDSHIDIEIIKKFLNKYQSVKPLLIGEIWAVAIALRLVLIENLRRLVKQIVDFQDIQKWADDCADQILIAAKTSESKVEEIKEELIIELKNAGTSDRFIIVQLFKRLRDQSSAVSTITECLEEHLESQNLNFDSILLEEYQRQAASQVTVSNIVNSMRLLSNVDWQDFFEQVNLVDPILEEDPADAYKVMDFKSRDRYRSVIEKIQKKTGMSEIKIAHEVLALAKRASVSELEDPHSEHVGYYLIDDGLRVLEKNTGYHLSFKERLKRQILDYPSVFYFSSLLLMITSILTSLMLIAHSQSSSLLSLILLALVALIPVSDSCLNILNLIVSRLINPRVLPKIDLENNTSLRENAFVVIPTILANRTVASKILDDLEVRYLSNQENNLFFALLSDFEDANSELMNKDNKLLDFLIHGIDELNHKYSSKEKKFFLFHRRRVWNDSENCWMGWERKRGKIHEFNMFLRGAKNTSFQIAPVFSEFFSNIRYVITLDADTQLPRGSAQKLLGTILHPLNRAQFDYKTNRVTRGYGILQPRISITPESSERSWFSKIFSGHTGIDPYTTAVSDVYQDLFGEGIFTGKGLYDVDCFQKALTGRVSENTLLSHDLFEGLFARAALVSEIEFLDDYPTQYEAFSKRQHRWTRGDWQIMRWLFGTVTDAHGKKVSNNLPLVSKWKILDNLRRSLVSTTLLLWFILGWTLLNGPVGMWSLIVIIVLALPFYIHAASNLFRFPHGVSWGNHLLSLWGDCKTNSIQLLLSITFIPHQAYLHSDAIVKTLYRIIFSKKNLLNWQTAASVESKLKSQRGLSTQIILTPILTSLGLYIFLFHFYPRSLFLASPILLLWALFPAFINQLSQLRLKQRSQLDLNEIDQFRNISRKTWNFFETFVTEQDNWLAPDNFQEDPRPLIAHRTSPTNMGMLLLSTSSAYNFGYIGSFNMLKRVRQTLSTMLKLERCFGHFYNWYDTESLLPLNPKYISTVDSGNLAGHLIAVKQSCLAIIDGPIISSKYIGGISDTLKIIEEKIQNLDGKNDLLLSHLKNCQISCSLKNGSSVFEYKTTLSKIIFNLEKLKNIVESMSTKDQEHQYVQINHWINSSLKMSKEYITQIDSFLPDIDQKLIDEVTQLLELKDSQAFANWQRMMGAMDSIKNLREHQALCASILTLLKEASDLGISQSVLNKVQSSILRIHSLCNELSESAEELSETCNHLVSQMDFSALFDSQRKLFSIGYNVEHAELDNSFYDLLASESRLASFIAIAKGDVPQSHWFHLGRQMTSIKNNRVLISWSASMFEYLMPLLVMKNYSNTLLNETEHAVINLQRDYSKTRKIPWGVSESAYNARDLQMNYQYGPFGIPGLGLKRGLSNDTVISPYSTALAAMVSNHDILNNFNRLIDEGLLTDFGFYEAIDFTTSRIKPGQHRVIIKNFMVHHQGMILSSLDNVLNDNILQKHFHADLLVRSSELLLQERTPKRVSIFHPRSEKPHVEKTENLDKHPHLRHVQMVNTAHPETQVISNTNYTVALNACGSGFSKRGNIFLSRWNEEPISETLGHYIFIEDETSKLNWSTSFAPFNKKPSAYKACFSEHKAEFWCHKNDISSHTEVIVSSEDDVEIRRVTLVNHSSSERTLNITSYLEPILTTHQADIAHRAFSNLFIETEYVPSKTALLAHRRKRSSSDAEVWAIHLVSSNSDNSMDVQYETSRNQFIGRANDIASPRVFTEGDVLSNTVGAVLDPVLSLRKQVTLAPHQTYRLCFVSGLTDSRDEALRLLDRYNDPYIFEREDEMGWTKSQAEMRHLNISFDEASSFQKLGNNLLYPCGPMRSIASSIELSSKPQSALWAYGISGDNPILFAIIKNQQELNLIRQLLHAHEYFRYKGISYDLVILNAETSSYRLELQDELLHQVRMAGQQGLINKDGGIFILREETLSRDDLLLFRTISRVYISAENGSLKDQMDRIDLIKEHSFKKIKAKDKFSQYNREIKPLKIPKRLFENDIGGFSEDGREYIICLNSDQTTPAPWCNVIANEKEFGFLVSERGSSYSWSKNSRENRISPWSNDPVCDPSGESLFIVDMETGEKWSPTPGPIKAPHPYLISHGQGYSRFENNNYEIEQTLSMFCSTDKELKINELKLKNDSSHSRKLSLTYFVELVLGPERAKSVHHIVTEQGQSDNVFIARNFYNEDFAKRITFITSSEKVTSFTCDRKSFLGVNGNYKNPTALSHQQLDGKIGAGLNPCIAIQVIIELQPQEEKSVSFILGQASSQEEIKTSLEGMFSNNNITLERERVDEFWDNILEVVQIKTSRPEFDILVNRWLLYQNLSCRIWARTAFYQSGGAIGFRDQLQDVTALLHSAPEVAKKQILTAAASQFEQGDVLHWWHPPSNKGVRTHFSDDLVWLPFVVSAYTKAVGENSILDIEVPFVEGPELEPQMEDLYLKPEISEISSSIYDHCVRAIDRSLKVGVHGLPLMGSGDWNDGMNKVGAGGQGESVWMAWFLISTLKSFLVLCEHKKDTARIEAYTAHIQKLSEALESAGWDGKWYKRAFFDDGTPLGSNENDECSIDSLTQSWAALSGHADPEHLKLAMKSLSENLIKKEDKLILLFAPPFDKTIHDPGYIKGYLPGIRENGGQYTHAAIWAAMGFAATQDGDQAFNVLSILNPINHSLTKKDAFIYAVEPYVIPADVYSNPAAIGRGGWTWYTGSAAWYYRAVTESVLGLYREGDNLRIAPCLPKDLSEYQVKYRFGKSMYEINIKYSFSEQASKFTIIVDGQKLDELIIPLTDDGDKHIVNISIS